MYTVTQDALLHILLLLPRFVLCGMYNCYDVYFCATPSPPSPLLSSITTVLCLCLCILLLLELLFINLPGIDGNLDLLPLLVVDDDVLDEKEEKNEHGDEI